MATIPDGLILSEVPIEHKSLIGSRVLEVNGISVDQLTEKAKKIAAIENLYGAYALLASNLRDVSFLKRILPLESTEDKE